MRSTFYGMDIANKGLFVSQRQIDLTAHNISNANTEGYTRQRFVTAAVPSPGMNGMWVPINKGVVGGGVETLSLDQVRDNFLDRQYRNESTKANYWDTKAGALYFVEDVFNNIDSVNISTGMQKFFAGMQELFKNPADGPVRVNLIENAKSMTKLFADGYEKLRDMMLQQDQMLDTQVKQVNELTSQIAQLNEGIFKYELTGNSANDLRDKRNLLLDQLSGLMDISYQEVGTGRKNINGLELSTIVVKIGGEILVDHTDYRALITQQDVSNDITNAYPSQPVAQTDLMHSVRFADSNAPVDIGGGTLKAYMDLRDGNTVDNQGMPYFVAQLDKLARALVEEINALHRTGYTMPYTDKNGVAHASSTGVDFFDPNCLTAATLRLSDAVLSSEFNVAAAHKEVIMDASGNFETGNNEVALALSKLTLRSDIAVIGGFDKFYNSFVTELGSEVSHANKMAEQELALCDGLNAQRLSVSGVSVDEEMTNLVRFQHAYNAAARVITAMDEALDVLINRTGRVGL